MSPTPSPRKPSWRGGQGPAGAGVGGSKGWQGQAAAAPPGHPRWKSKAVKGGLAFCLLVGVFAAAIWVIRWFQPAPSMRLVLIGASYDEDLAVPHNVYGARGLDALASWASAHNDAAAAGDGKIEVRKVVDDWGKSGEKVIDAVKDPPQYEVWKRRATTVVVVVAAHGLARRDGEGTAPYLVGPNGAFPDRLFALDKVLEALQQLPEKTRKVLILDVTRVGAHWPLGQLHNGLAGALANHPRLRQVPNLVVISSSDKDQRSWDYPEKGVTAFNYFLLKELSAVGGRVGAADLFEKVRDGVKGWAASNRARLQSPVLFQGESQSGRVELRADGAYEPPNLPALGESDLKDLAGEWGKCLALGRASPPPAAYAPHLWRKYLDTLLRYEELLRAGAPDKTSRLKTSLAGLHDQIVAAAALKLDAAQLTLTMPDALGLGPTGAERTGLDGLDRLLRDERPMGEVRKALTALEQAHRDRWPLLRVWAAARVMRWVTGEKAPEGRLATGREVLGRLDDQLAPWRPAEAHHLVMLWPDLAGKLSPAGPLLAARGWPRLHRSLGLRLAAEQAALGLGGEGPDDTRLPPYSERVLPWVRGDVDKADALRRLGQDLLFTSESKSWDEAEGHFKQAEKLYQGAQRVGAEVRRALMARDEVLARLPYYTRWAGGRPFPEAADEAAAVRLWGLVYRLQAGLDQAPSEERARELDQLARELNEGMEKFRAVPERLAARGFARANTQNDWHEIENLLTVPFLEPAVRVELVRNTRRISGELVQHSAGAEAPTLPPEKPPQEAAQRQGRLALATLGETWPEHKDVSATVANPERGGRNWSRTLTDAGESIGGALNRRPEDAQKKTEAAEKAELTPAAVALREAAGMARHLEGYMVGAAGLKDDPVGARRRLQVHDLLCWQAERAFLDYWASEPGKGQPYYREAGLAFVKDAEALVVGKSAEKVPGRLARVEAERDRLKPRGEVVVRWSASGAPASFRPGPAHLDLTDDLAGVERYYRLEAPEGMPPGWTVYRVVADAGLEGGGPEAKALARKFDVQGESLPARLKVAKGAADRSGPLRHSVSLYFRGHRSSVETTVLYHSEPGLIVSVPPTDATPAQLAVTSEKKLPDAAIALVLDCSGSMIEKGADGRTRLTKAKEALKAVVGQLPDDVWVSLRAFGHKGHEGSSELIWKARPWNRASHLAPFTRKVDGLELNKGSTPLVRSVWEARHKDFPSAKELKGARSIVALTDGGDNFFNFPNRDNDLKQLVTAGPKTIQNFLREEFTGSGIQLNVIGFEVTEDEKKDNVSPVDKKPSYAAFKEAVEALGGDHYDAQQPDQLAEALRRSLLQSYFWVDPDKGADPRGVPKEGREISHPPANPRPVKLASGTYQARVAAALSLRQRVQVEPGEFLLLSLGEGPGGQPGLRRALYTKSHLLDLHGGVKRVVEGPGGWRLAALQNEQLPGKRSLTIMAALEQSQGTERFGKPGERIQQVRPEWTWFEVSAPGGKGPAPQLRVAPLAGYPAPAWRLQIDRWPGGASALKAWWWEANQPLPEVGRLPNPAASRAEVDAVWPNKEDPENVIRESLRLEDVTPVGEKQTYKALFVRLRFPKDKPPYFVQLRDWKYGQEHRFYPEAGKYTAVFYPMTEEQFREQSALLLISVNEFKRKARGLEKVKDDHVKEGKLDLGEPTDHGPPPPLGP